MAVKTSTGVLTRGIQSNKGTSIGRRNIKMSSMNKKKKASFKKYKGQG